MWLITRLLLFIAFSSKIDSATIVKNSADNELFPLAIVHLNDFHARFEETNLDSTSCKEHLGQICIGGYARAMTLVKKLLAEREAEEKNPIFLNIGDNFQGTLWYELLGWNVTSHFLNILPADATTLGNHEFDRGVKEVVHFLEHLHSPVVVANLDDTDEPELQGLYKKSIVIERRRRRIGLVGALVVATEEISNPENLHILDEIQSVKAEAERLRNEEEVDIVIVLSHCGLVIDREMAIQGGSAIDIIVGGHSHTLLYNGTPVPGPDVPPDTYPIVYEHDDGHKVLIVQASAYTKYLGDLVVYFDDDGEIQFWEGNPIFINNDVEPDPEILREMEPWKAMVDEVALREIGTIKTTLYQRDCAFGECNIGSFITDAFVDYFVSHPDYQEPGGWTYGTISYTNAGGIRTTLAPGMINYDDLFTSLPFQNTIDTFELRGEHLLEVLEFSAAAYSFYNFLQFSGMRVVFNISQPINERVVSADVLCRECEVPRYERLDVNQWYRIIGPSFISGGGNGYVMFKNSRNYRVGDKMDIDLVERYIKKMEPVIQPKDGRIVILT